MNFLGRIKPQRFYSMMVRQNFSNQCEKALNQQINLELKASQDYLAMAYHFNRSDVALPGVYHYFKQASDEERKHAELIMKYMNKRGGYIILESIPAPKSKYASTKEAMEMALCLEKTVNESLLELHAVANKENDPNLCDFVESHFLQEQVDAQKQIADFITQIELCDKHLGTYIFDVNLRNIEGAHGTEDVN